MQCRLLVFLEPLSSPGKVSNLFDSAGGCILQVLLIVIELNCWKIGDCQESVVGKDSHRNMETRIEYKQLKQLPV